jgi:tyrosyl-DNA phosphodiesterase-1
LHETNILYNIAIISSCVLNYIVHPFTFVTYFTIKLTKNMSKRRSRDTDDDQERVNKRVKNEQPVIIDSDDDDEVEEIDEPVILKKQTRASTSTSTITKQFNTLPPSYTFGLNKTYDAKDESNTFWFEDLFQPPTVDPPARLSTYLKRIVLTTYNVDIEWLFSATTSHRRITYADNIILVHGMQSLQTTVPQIVKSNPNLPFSQLYKSKKLSVHMPDLKLDYGTVHGKLYLIYFENSLRVVVTTSNLTRGDWKSTLQGSWIQEFPKKKSKITANDFEKTLVDYLNKLQLPDEAKRVTEFDFSSAMVTLITSCPGYYSYNKSSYGHMKVRKTLSRLATDNRSPTTHCLFSSLGTLDEKYLNTELRTSLSIPEKTKKLQSGDSNMAIIWPTVKCVKNSLSGMSGADHYCADKKKFKPWLEKCLHRWNAKRIGILSHTKLYTQAQTEGDTTTLPWVYLTSANLSKAAHGQLIKDGNTLMIRSFEIGVLFIPTDSQLFVPCGTSVASNHEVIEFPIPYHIPLVHYKSSDRPWCIEEFNEG